jgi:hypothetical protein
MWNGHPLRLVGMLFPTQPEISTSEEYQYFFTPLQQLELLSLIQIRPQTGGNGDI